MLPNIALDRVNVHLGTRHVLHDVSWSLTSGQHWAITGPNGSGKSTLLRVISGTQWIDADGGARTYSPDGLRRDVVARAATWIRHVTAEQHERYARLELALSGRSVIESGFADSLYVQRAPSAAQTQRVDALIDELDLHAIAQRPLRELSSGQIRRLLIARALVGEPRVIVLDEFTNGLDAGAREDVFGLLDRLAPHVAFIVASHRGDDFPAAITHSVTIADGRLSPAGIGRPRPQRWSGQIGQLGGPVRDDCAVLVRIANADVYRGPNLVLGNVNWELRRGQHTSIRGANGAGKTTFAGLIAGTIAPATGAQIERFGETGPFDIWKLKERIAHVSDDLQIAYDLGETVEAVVASGFPSSIGLFRPTSPAQREAVVKVMNRLGLASLRDRTFTALSFGERRKVLIARGLVRRPEIFVLDEIWSGLDFAFRHVLRELIAELARSGTTVVAIAHNEDDDITSLAARVCTIVNGEIDTAPASRRYRPAAKSC